MSKIYTIGGNTSGGSTLVANGGGVAKKSYDPSYHRIATIIRPKYSAGEAMKVCREASKYVGYLEKKTNAQIEEFKANAGYNNYNMFAVHARQQTGSSVYMNGVAWCDMFVDDMFIRALGVTRAKQLLGDWSAYTPTSKNLLIKAGAKELDMFSLAQAGDIIFFKNSKRICHVEIVVTGIDTFVPSANTTYSQADFIKDVCGILGVRKASQAFEKTRTLSTKTNSNDALVLPLQKYLKALGYYKKTCDREFGSGTKSAVSTYQKEILSYKKTDGEVTARNKMWKSLLGLE